MLQLIIAVIAIALFALLVLIGVYYGGIAYSDSGARATYAQNLNSATQIQAAMQLYYQDHLQNPTTVDGALLQQLHDESYLKDVPAGDWRVQPGVLYKPIEVQSVDTCKVMNRAAGYDVSLVPSRYGGCPPCNGAAGSQQLADAKEFSAWPGCQFIQ